MRLLDYKNEIIEWIRSQVLSANKKGVIVGLSGGVDSSVVAGLAKEAFPQNSLGVFMPINNMGQDLNDAMSVANKLNIETKLIDLTDSFKVLSQTLAVSSKLAIANQKPRLRMITLYALAQELDYLVLGTDNADEILVGYFTKYGDGGVDLLPISHLTKQEVRELAKHYDFDPIIWQKRPTAALWDNQYDEDELGITYDEIDQYILGNNHLLDQMVIERIEQLDKISSHKKNPIPKPKPFIR